MSLITVKVLGDTLADLRSRSKELRGPILYLELVSSRLRRAGLKDNREARAAALADLLRELAWTNLCSARGAVNGNCPPMNTDCFSECMEADFGARAKIREYWSAVWYRFLSEASPTKEEIAQAAKMVRTTFWRRSVDGIELFHPILIATELKSRRGLVSPNVPPAPIADAAQSTRAEAILARVKQRLGEARADALQLDAAERRLILSRSWDSLDLYRLRQALIWSDERFKLDERFVDLSLLVDLGEDAPTERWQVQERRYDSLEAVLAEQPDPAFVVLGAPGSGKSTLLRHHELGITLDGLRGVTNRISIFVPLSRYGSRDSDVPPFPPLTWLAAEWQAANPGLAPLTELLAGQEVTLLLDAVNEMPHRDAADYQSRVSGWRRMVEDLADRQPGNRVIFSCRSLDYSAPLSTKVRAVPQLRIEPLDDTRVQAFLATYCPRQADRIWEELKDQPQLGLLRTPFLLRMLAQQAERDRHLPTGRAALFSSFIRGLLRNEVQGDNPRFAAGALVSERERNKIVSTQKWTRPFDLPGEDLFPPLSALAYAMQDQHGSSESAQIRLPYEEALDRLQSGLAEDRAEAVLQGGCDLGLLDQDRGLDEVLFRHQLLQEYFAARKLAREPRTRLAASEWRADLISPSVEELIETLAPAEPLPPLPTTGWEETMLLAGAMAPNQDRFVASLAEANLPLAGRCAAQPESKVGEEVREKLRWALVNRSRDPQADLRARIAAGEALGELGDPRFKRCLSAEGVEYLLPPMVTVPAGSYWIGAQTPVFDDDMLYQRVEASEFGIAQFPVTKAEYARFIAANGYFDDRWWDTSFSKRWRDGESSAFGQRESIRVRCREFRRDLDALSSALAVGTIDEQKFLKWKRLISMDEIALEQYLLKTIPDERYVVPAAWAIMAPTSAIHPVSGVCWYEARAYCMWLSHHSCRLFRLPSEAEWAGAASLAINPDKSRASSQGATGPNTVEMHVNSVTPIGVFEPVADHQILSDVLGNVSEWVSTAFGLVSGETMFSPRYSTQDGREDPNLPDSVARLTKGGSYQYDRRHAREALRFILNPGTRTTSDGFRLAETIQGVSS
ncbi:MAG: SUMF1/EgtB/PvdO family nonheme iron enzyme [Ardenticatenia bacterium]|nr:SUMF1/EgtB/PvdO family nonheme iron enzyme [Ardenticatenia bacterium]